jgi:hypothetical protein
MAQFYTPTPNDPATYEGLDSIFEFLNGDGKPNFQKFNCGQAAACTLLTHLRFYQPDEATAPQVLGRIESEHPPDNVAGWAGSSRRRVERICLAHGLDVMEVDGEDALKDMLDRRMPVIVMLQTQGASIWKFTIPGGHWVVAFAYDSTGVYVTNNSVSPIPWDLFREKWNGIMTRMNNMQGVGIAAVPQIADVPNVQPGSGQSDIAVT